MFEIIEKREKKSYIITKVLINIFIIIVLSLILRSFRSQVFACSYISMGYCYNCYCVNNSWAHTMDGYYQSCTCQGGAGWCTCTPACTSCTAWVESGCGGVCASTQRRQTRTCSPSGCSGMSETQCLADSCTSWANTTCGSGTCTSSQMRQTRSCTYGCDITTRCVADSCGAWSDAGCGTGGCGATQMRQTRSCTYSCLATSQCLDGVTACNQYTVTLNYNSGTCSPAAGNYAIYYDQASPTISSCSRTGYNLTGFALTSGSCYGTFNSSTGICSAVRAAMTITAQWQIKTYQVTYAGGATGATCTNSPQTINHGSNTTNPNCSRTGYDLTGFSRTSGSGGTLNTSTGIVTGVTGDQTITAQWQIKTYDVTYAGGGTGAICTNSPQTINHGGNTTDPNCSRPEYNLTGFSRTSGSGGTLNTSTGIVTGVTGIQTITAEWVINNVAPTEPTSLLVNSNSSPAVVADIPPYFSAIFNDPNPSDSSTQYQIQVNTNSSFTGTVIWDSGLTSMSSTANGARSPNITYNGTALSLDGTTYYWRIRFADSYSLISPWSDTAQFTMNRAPTEATSLQTNSKTNPSCISNTPSPSFSAIFNDPDGHSGTQYQIQVNTNSSFTGTVMWDSSLTSMTTTANGTRSPEIAYNGSALANNGNTYYWRIRFADQYGTIAPWSLTANFTMNTPPTAPTQPLTESLVNPIDVGTFTPKFSAIFNDPDTCEYTEYSEFYRIQVNTNSSFTGSTLWDSGQSSMAKTDKGLRSPEITYNGSTLTLNGNTYYWRIKFWDSVESESPWSSTAQFTMETNQTPTAPTSLRVDGITDNNRVNNPNPHFSAIYNDPNVFDFSNYYEIHVNTQDDFAGTVMWNTGKQYMATTIQGERSPNFTYDGLTLNLLNTVYYWRIRFWDSVDAVSPWGYGQFTTSGAYTTFQGLQLSNLKFE